MPSPPLPPSKVLKGCSLSTLASPSLYVDAGGEPAFKPECVLALVIFSDANFNGHWQLHDDEKAALLHQIEQSVDRETEQDGTLSTSEIVAFGEVQENRDMVFELPSAVHGILNPSLVRDALDSFDIDKSNSLDVAEWDGFLDKLEALRMEFLLELAFQQFQAFFCRGQLWAPEADHPWRNKVGAGHTRQSLSLVRETLQNAVGTGCHPLPDEDSDCELAALVKEVAYKGLVPKLRQTIQIGMDEDCLRTNFLSYIIPPGWWDDLVFYSANNHPLHGMFSCDRNHPLSKLERVAMELATLGFSFFTVRLKYKWTVMHEAPISLLEDPVLFGLVVVTFPGIVIWWVLFLLFTCPKFGQIDESIHDRSEVRKARHCEYMGRVLAFILVAIGLGGVIWRAIHIVVGHSDHGMHLRTVIVARLEGYLFAWGTMFCIYFNPVFAWGQSSPDGPRSFGDWVGFGQWRVQKQKFQALCIVAHDRVIASIRTAPDSAFKPTPRRKRGGLLSWCSSAC